MPLVLGFDVGTQGTKAVVVDVEQRAIVARAACSYGLLAGLPPGSAEQHPETWVEALCEVSRTLLADPAVDPRRLVALGVSAQQHGLVVLDAAGEVVRPAKLWCDTSTTPEARELSEALGREVPTGFTASKVLWLARHEPESWARTRSVLLPHDYVNYRLTGRRCTEAGDASGTGYFDPALRDYDARAVAAVDPRLEACLPELLAPAEPAGRLSPEAAALTGLPEGLLVSAGGGDNMLSAVGSGATRAGVVVLSLGTSGTAFAYAPEPVVDPEGLIAPFCGSVGGWLPLLCVMNMTGVAQEVSDGFGLGHDALTAAAREVPPGCDGLLWLPYLAGERVPDLPHATGTLLGMRAGHLRPGVLYRAALEGTSLNLGWGLERMRALGIGAERVHVVGGGARNRLWCEVLASVLDLPVQALAEPESAALGAALQALWCSQCASGASLDPHAVAAPYVHRAGEASLPEEGPRATYAELAGRFRRAVREGLGPA